MQKSDKQSVISPNACSAARSAGPPSRCRRRCCSAARFPPPRPSLNRRTHFRFPAQSAIRPSLPLYADDGTAGLPEYTPTLPKPEDAASPSEGLTDKQMLAWQEEQKKQEQAQTPQTPVTSDKPAEPEQRSERKPPTSRPRASRANARSAARTGSFTTGRTGTNTKTSPTAIKPSAAMAAGRPIWR